MPDIQIKPVGTVTPIEDLYKNAAPAAPEITATGILYRDGPPVPPENPPKAASGINAHMIGMENDRLAALQRTVPYLDKHEKNFLGEATHEWDDGTVTYKDSKGEELPTNAKEHVVLRDPNSGKYMIYKRHESTDVGAIKNAMMAAGRMLGEGYATSTLPMVQRTTQGIKMLEAQQALKGATGVEVPISKLAVSAPGGVMEKTANVASHIPGGTGPLVRSAGETAGGLASAAGEAGALSTGVRGTAEEAGQAARFGINERIKSGGLFDEAVGKSYDKVDSHIRDHAKSLKLDNLRKTAVAIQNDHKSAGHDGVAPVLKDMVGAIKPEGLTYAGVKRLRSEIGEKIKQGVNTDLNNGDLKRIYGALTEDLKATVGKLGGKRGLAAWEKANAHAKVSAAQKDKLSKLLGVKSDEGVHDRIVKMAGSTSSADAKTLALAKRSMSPSEWAEVQSAAVGRLGTRGSGKDTVFDPNQFLRDYGRLSPAGKNTLFGDKKLRDALDSIATISEGWDRIKRTAHPTGENTHLAGILGMVHAPMHALGAFVGSNITSRLLTTPATASTVANWVNNYKLMALKPTNANMVALSNASKVLAHDAAEEARKDIGTAAGKLGSPIDTASDLYSKFMGILKGK